MSEYRISPPEKGEYSVTIQRSKIAIEKDPSSKGWDYYALNVEYTGIETPIPSGDVLECKINSNTYYRFIDSMDNVNGYPVEDSFYSDFDGTNLTNLIVIRG